jgi:hypothetical protein
MKIPLRPGETNTQLATLVRPSPYNNQQQALGGSLQLVPGGHIKVGQSDYNVGTGFWLGLDDGVPKLSLGVSTGDKLTWDGDSLDITGNLTATTGTIGGFTINSTTITGGDVTLDSTGNVRAGQTAYDTGTGFWIGVPVAAEYLSCPGVTGNHASTPDSADASITGDIDIRADLSADDWTPSATKVILAKWGTSNLSYWFGLLTTGALSFGRSTNGTGSNFRTSSVLGFSDGSFHQIRVTYNSTSGLTSFYEFVNGAWSLINSDTMPGAGAIFDGNASVLVGDQNVTGFPWDGRIYRAKIYNGIDGTLAVDFNPADADGGDTSIVSSATGETWTIHQSGSPSAELVSVAKLSLGNSSGDALTWNGLDLNITGDITADGGTIGGFTIGSTSITATNLTLDSSGQRISLGSGTDIVILDADDASYRLWVGHGTAVSAPFRVEKDGGVTCTDISVTGGSVVTSVLSGLVALANTNVAAQGWTQTSAFSVTDADTVAWGAGTFTTAGGTSYSIGAGNTGNMAAKTYIYLDIGVSTTAYQTTTTASTAVGAGKVLVAVAQNGTDEATFTVLDGSGVNINASSIAALSITANEIAASTITAGKLTISSLSAIAADMGTITAGTITLDSAGHIKSGQTAYNTGTGFFLGIDGSTPKFSIGNPATASLTWDGTDLTINGELNIANDFIIDLSSFSWQITGSGDFIYGNPLATFKNTQTAGSGNDLTVLIDCADGDAILALNSEVALSTWFVGVSDATGNFIISEGYTSKTFGTNTALSITTSGNATLTGTLTVNGTGTSTISGPLAISGASAGQIVFPATQNASSDANTLDDYEEGTWTPTVSAASGTITTASATGAYTKIGRAVFGHTTVTITTNGTGAGSVRFTLPFTPGRDFVGVGRDTGVTGELLQVVGASGATTVDTYDYANNYPGADGAVLKCSFHFYV